MEPDLEPATSRALARELKEIELLQCRWIERISGI
jgi:hypothetical protein